MPELPDVELYLRALKSRIDRRALTSIDLHQPFFLRTAAPPVSALIDRQVNALRRIGKRIAIGFDNDHWLVVHLMIAGRLHWSAQPPKPTRRTLATFVFASGALSITEAGNKKRAALHVIANTDALREIDPGGAEIDELDAEAFSAVLRQRNHTLKRALTDPRIFSGVGNAYSDEILWQARLSPVALTQKLDDTDIQRLYEATRDTLHQWTARLARENGDRFPQKVTAFREGMAVHGRYGHSCPRCGTQVQRIRYASNETNYCPRCQTGGQMLADRSLSRLLKKDWPRTIEELENRAP